MSADPYLIQLQPGDSDVTRDLAIQRWLTAIYNAVSSGGGGSVPSIAAYSAYVNNTNASAVPTAAQVLFLGTPGYTETNINTFAVQQTGNISSYFQWSLQNQNAGSTSSADLVIGGDLETASTYFLNAGWNSSGFTGSGAFNKANSGYITTTSGDLAIGTTTANAIHFVVNSGTTDAVTVNTAAASTPWMLLPGTWFTGGNASTNWPQLYLRPSGTTDPTFNANGTGFGINAPSGFTGNLIAAYLNGATTEFTVSSAGVVSANGSYLAPLGSAANPVFAFSAATTTGIYSSNPGIGFSVAGSSVGTFTATGWNNATNSFTFGGGSSFADVGAGNPTINAPSGKQFVVTVGGTNLLTATATSLTWANLFSTGATAYTYGALPSGTGINGLAFTTPAQTYTVTGTNTASYVAGSYFGIPTITNPSVGTATTAATLYVAGAPVAAGSQVLTNPYSLYVAGGPVYMNSNITTPYGLFAKNINLNQGGNNGSAWGASGNLFQVSSSTSQDTSTAASGTATLETFSSFAAPILSATNTSVTTTEAATVYIGGAPTAGTNQTITRAHSLAIVDSTSAASSITGGFVIANTLGTAATSVGIGGGNINAGGTLTVGGTSTFTGATTHNNAVTINGAAGTTALTITNTARTSGVLPYIKWTIPTDTGLTAATEAPGIVGVTGTRTWATTGTVALQREVLFVAPTYASASASQTFTIAATVAISGAPIQGTNAVLTNPLALYVQGGTSWFAGPILATSASGAIGYATGQSAGSTVVQATSRTTGVTLNNPTGAITLFSTTTTAGQVTTFVLSNTTIGASDTLVLGVKGAFTGIYFFSYAITAAGSASINVYTPAAVGSAEAPVIQYAVVKGSAN